MFALAGWLATHLQPLMVISVQPGRRSQMDLIRWAIAKIVPMPRSQMD
jgi:hypothetical protein